VCSNCILQDRKRQEWLRRGYLDEKKQATMSVWLLAISQVFSYANDRVRWPSLFIAPGIRVNTKVDADSLKDCDRDGGTRYTLSVLGELETKSSRTKKSSRREERAVVCKAQNYNALGKPNFIILQYDYFICASTLFDATMLCDVHRWCTSKHVCIGFPECCRVIIYLISMTQRAPKFWASLSVEYLCVRALYGPNLSMISFLFIHR